MELKNSQVVWVAFASNNSGVGGTPYADVSRAVVIDAEHGVVRRDNGYVGVISRFSVEHCHESEAAAWTACADLLDRSAEAVVQKSDQCRQRAAEAAARAEVVTTGGACV